MPKLWVLGRLIQMRNHTAVSPPWPTGPAAAVPVVATGALANRTDKRVMLASR